MATKSLRDLYVSELKDIYSAERQLLSALQRMLNAAHKPELKTALGQHLDQTRVQITRLDHVFEGLHLSPKGKKSIGMAGLIHEGYAIIKEEGESAVKDAALIGAAQRIEHHEMATYGTVRALAHTLGYDDDAKALQATLDEEGRADQELSAIAISMIDPEADQRHPEYGSAYYLHSAEES